MNERAIYALKFDGAVFYIGMTVTPARRLYTHQRAAHKGSTSKVYQYMRKVGVAKCTMEVLETFDGTPKQARMRETDTINKYIAGDHTLYNSMKSAFGSVGWYNGRWRYQYMADKHKTDYFSGEVQGRLDAESARKRMHPEYKSINDWAELHAINNLQAIDLTE